VQGATQAAIAQDAPADPAPAAPVDPAAAAVEPAILGKA
jgi:hypothetical protein